jgi:UDP:flavonoid glycosyltransferase YjiC (YdhE family)
MSTPLARKRILFVAEAVTLAHVGRPLALASMLDPGRFDIALACDPRAQWAYGDFPGLVLPVHSIPSAQFLQALAVGRPAYDEATLMTYVREDRQVLKELRPDLVVGDFRLSLSVSARLEGVRYIAISNAYWSPYYSHARYVVPEHPSTRFLPIAFASAFFRATRPGFFALHSRPLNRVRRRFGLPSLGLDLRRTYTDADQVLYADVPELFPLTAAPRSHDFLGPIIWAPPVAAPDWWGRMPVDRPLVYVTLGSSGRAALLDLVLAALAPLDLSVTAATASDRPLPSAPANARIARYLPGDEAARRAALVICNGGSPTSQQALAAGVPVIGIASNLDQFLNMQAIEEAEAGVLLRSDRVTVRGLQSAVKGVLGNRRYRAAAQKVATWFEASPAPRRFTTLLDAVGSGQGGDPFA